MSRFANPKLTKRYVIPGPCGCTGQPHDEDWIDVRTEVGAIEVIGDSTSRLLAIVAGWNLLDYDGSEAPVDAEHIERLFTDLFEPFNAWVSKNLRVKAALPNASGAPSRNGSEGSASQTQTTPTTG